MMTAEQLKGSILQLAMQGKLVEQRPEEGTGEELYKKIQEEKKRLIKDGIIKKEKQIDPPLDDEIPFEIPEDWIWARFGDITYNRDSERIPLSVNQRATLKKKYDYYGASGVIDKVDRYLFDKPLLLIGEDGANLLNRSTPIAFIATGKYWVNNHAHVLDMNNMLDMRFLSFYINSISLAKYVTGTAQPKMNQAKMNSIWVPLPPLAEQKRIVAKIEELMPFVEQYAAASTKLNMLNTTFPEMMKKSILQEAVQGKFVQQDPNDEPASVLLKKIAEEKKRLIKEGKIKKEKPLPEITEDEIPFEIPESWEWVRFSQVINIVSNLVRPEDYLDKLQIAPDSIGKGNGVLLNKRSVRESGVKSPNHHFYKGQILYSKIRPALRKVVEAPDEGLCSADMYPLSTMMDNHYVIYYMLSDMFTNLVTVNANRVKMPKVNQEELNSVLVPVPPLREQIRIGKKLDDLFPIIEKLLINYCCNG